MTLAVNALPFGLREVVLNRIQADGTLGPDIKLPASRTFSFSETEDFEELRGDDRLIAERGQGPSVDWDLEAGGISLQAYQVMAGGEITDEGTDPALERVYSKGGYDVRPYFQVRGRAISDSGGDVMCTVFRCRANGDISGEFTDGSFWLTSCSGRGYPPVEANAEGKFPLYEFRQRQTAAQIESAP